MRGLVFLVGFVGGWVVPKTVDEGAATPLAAALATDLALFALFAVPHSLMARARFKRWLAAQDWPVALERSLYALVAGVTLALLIWQWRPIPGVVWEVGPEWAR
ncbi:MAG TPA: isoprenylcysteine carboxylmethyltransferase family protein, partial [Thermoanaerobaculia bacterium]|nr:isoprenylcysteine carboxylmethyltransferase family protein [Thermoanaerobaculia bacterium]